MQKQQVIIIGAGLAGLTLAYKLKQQGINALILEGRPRLGGRIHTVDKAGVTFELGATWFAEKHQSLNRLIDEIGVEKITQEYGRYAIYEMADQAPVLYPLPEQPEVTYRLKQGSMALINALASRLSSDQIQLNETVLSLDFGGESVTVETEKASYKVQAVVNTLPPNLLANSVNFSPELPGDLQRLCKLTHTWMGESIKGGFFADSAFWLEKQIGTLYSQKGPVTEMYDHSNERGYAMKGFISDHLTTLKDEEREALIRSQLNPLFGTEALESIEVIQKAWAEDAYTYVPYESDIFPHQNNGATLFRQPFFDQRFFMAGSETAVSFPGYMDGAVEAASRVAKQLAITQRSLRSTESHKE